VDGKCGKDAGGRTVGSRGKAKKKKVGWGSRGRGLGKRVHDRRMKEGGKRGTSFSPFRTAGKE